MRDLITLTDGYKLDHRRQYPVGTQYVYSNFTARSSRIPGADSVVFFGLQYFLREYFMTMARETFFAHNRSNVVNGYAAFLEQYLGPNHGIGVDHIRDLHSLGYLPLRIRALPEGTSVPLRVPMLTIENTLPEFYWLTNYFETLMSSVLWMPCTSASTALRYRKLLSAAADATGGSKAFVDWQGHDFSFRGMAGVEAAELSGAGHLLSFTGTDSIPAINLLNRYYYGGIGGAVIGGSVPATEHSVMCAGGAGDELGTFRHLLNLYPKGVVSVVSDTWDLWKVIGEYLPLLKSEILARDGKLVIRPDSGDPVRILTGDSWSAKPERHEEKGVVECLWDIFGGTVNAQGYKELDSHIGAIYGDSITEERAAEICRRLKEKGFASTNVVFGIGSYTYQYVTRDVHGFAVKATWAQVNGEERMLFKDPKTDNGLKRSARGRMVVRRDVDGRLRMLDGLTRHEQAMYVDTDQLQTVWEDGLFKRTHTLREIRSRVSSGDGT